MRTLLLPAAALLLLCAAPLHAQSYLQLTNAQNGAGCASSRGGLSLQCRFPAVHDSVTVSNAIEGVIGS